MRPCFPFLTRPAALSVLVGTSLQRFSSRRSALAARNQFPMKVVDDCEGVPERVSDHAVAAVREPLVVATLEQPFRQRMRQWVVWWPTSRVCMTLIT